MSKQIWDQIPENIQQSISKSSEESELLLREEIRRLDDKAIEIMEEYGLVVHHVDKKDRAKWEEMVKHVYPYIRGKMVPEDMFDKVIKLRDNYRDQ